MPCNAAERGGEKEGIEGTHHCYEAVGVDAVAAEHAQVSLPSRLRGHRGLTGWSGCRGVAWGLG